MQKAERNEKNIMNFDSIEFFDNKSKINTKKYLVLMFLNKFPEQYKTCDLKTRFEYAISVSMKKINELFDEYYSMILVGLYENFLDGLIHVDWFKLDIETLYDTDVTILEEIRDKTLYLILTEDPEYIFAKSLVKVSKLQAKRMVIIYRGWKYIVHTDTMTLEKKILDIESDDSHA